MFFLKCGVVTLSQRERGVLGHLDAGEYFGEMCLLSSKVFGARAFSMNRRTCTITAHTLVDVMVLNNVNLERVVCTCACACACALRDAALLISMMVPCR